jgi:predicted  nucleic acid-binding Zn-ribbon protein
VQGLIQFFNDEPAYFLLLCAIGISALFFFYFRPARPSMARLDIGAQKNATRAHEAEKILNQARVSLEREARILEDLRRTVAGEVNFGILRQKHHESRLIADAWHTHTREVEGIRRALSADLNGMRDHKRRMARRRDNAAPRRRGKVVAELRTLQIAIDSIYSVISSLDQELDRGRQSRTAYNKQTASLRDHIRYNCGEQGHRWYSRLETRKRTKAIDK